MQDSLFSRIALWVLGHESPCSNEDIEKISKNQTTKTLENMNCTHVFLHVLHGPYYTITLVQAMNNETMWKLYSSLFCLLYV